MKFNVLRKQLILSKIIQPETDEGPAFYIIFNFNNYFGEFVVIESREYGTGYKHSSSTA